MQIVKKTIMPLFLLIILTSAVNALSFSDVLYSAQGFFSNLSNFIPFYEENFAFIDFILLLIIFFLATRVILELRFGEVGVKLAFVLSLVLSFTMVYWEVQRDSSFVASNFSIIFPIALAALFMLFLKHFKISSLWSFIITLVVVISLIAFFSEKSGIKLPQPFRAYAMWALLGLIAFLIIKYGWRNLSKAEDQRIHDKRSQGTPELDIRLKKD